MLVFGSRLIGAPVMSLHTGAQLAQLSKPLVDPANLHIIAYEIEGDLLAEHPSFLPTRDIREYGRYGMIINSNDDIVGLEDIIKIKSLHELNFSLVGLTVIDQHKHKLGKVNDYSIDMSSFVIQQLDVKRGVFKSITDTGLLINRSQILEINNTQVIVRSPHVKAAEPIMNSVRKEFVNPFRSTAPTSSTKDLQQ